MHYETLIWTLAYLYGETFYTIYRFAFSCNCHADKSVVQVCCTISVYYCIWEILNYVVRTRSQRELRAELSSQLNMQWQQWESNKSPFLLLVCVTHKSLLSITNFFFFKAESGKLISVVEFCVKWMLCNMPRFNNCSVV